MHIKMKSSYHTQPIQGFNRQKLVLIFLEGFYKLPGRELEQAIFGAHLSGILPDEEVRKNGTR